MFLENRFEEAGVEAIGWLNAHLQQLSTGTPFHFRRHPEPLSMRECGLPALNWPFPTARVQRDEQ